MADHEELVAEMLALEQMGTQERQKLAKKRRLQQLKKWGQREKEWVAKERQLNKRLASMLHEENNGLDLKQYTTYGSNQRPKRRTPAIAASCTNANGTSNNNNNNIITRNHNINNGKDYVKNQNDYVDPNLIPNGRVHFNVGVMLLEAAARNDIEEVKRLLMLGVSPDSINHDGLTALHQCCIDASEPIMRLLLEYGGNVDARDTEQWTPLHAACTCGHLNLVKILVEHGADLLAVNGDGNMPFDICEDEATLDYIESQMVQRGITQEMIDITRASTEVQMINDLEELVANGSDLNDIANENGVSPLHIAAANGYTSVVKFLLKYGVDVNVCDKDLWRPLHGAACWGNEQHCSVVELLVESGAQLMAKTINDETVFDLCDNVGLLEKLNQLKDELESKQATDTNKLKRTQSRTNSRVHSVRRTSVRDKNQISRREAREEALLRVENTPASNSNGNPTSNGVTQAKIGTHQEDANYKTQDSNENASKPPEPVNPHDAGTDQTDSCEPSETPSEIEKVVEQSDNISPTQQEQEVQRSHSIIPAIEMTTAAAATAATTSNDKQSKSNLPSFCDLNGKLDVNPTDSSPLMNEAQNRRANEIVIEPRDSEVAKVKPQNQQVSISTVQLVPVNYTLSNLKKHRSDLRMRTTSIGGGLVSVPSTDTSLSHQPAKDSTQSKTTSVTIVRHKLGQNRQQIVLDPRSAECSSSANSSDLSQRPESPNSTIRKFYGEPGEVIGNEDRAKSGHKCCIII